jgi:hypothetical protein
MLERVEAALSDSEGEGTGTIAVKAEFGVSSPSKQTVNIRKKSSYL